MITRRTNEIVVTKACSSATAAAALLGILCPLQLALGQDSGSVTVDVEHCLELESATARRACFGAQVDEVLGERGSVESENRSQVIEASNADQNRRTEDETSIERELPVRAATETRAVDQSRESETDESEYFGTIVAMRERLPFSYLITLDNGQIWEQTQPKRYPLRPGLEVRIYPSRWGGYRLTGVGSGGNIQVRRLR